MALNVLFITIIIAVLIINYILSPFFGLDPLFVILKNQKSTIRMGLSATFVMITASLINFLIVDYFLLAFEITYLRAVSFILIIVFICRLVELIIKKYSPDCYPFTDTSLPYLIINCTAIGIGFEVMDYFESGFTCSWIGPLRAIMYGSGAGIAFTVVLLLLGGIQERLEFSEIPDRVKGLPISLIVSGLLALAFLGFAGIKI